MSTINILKERWKSETPVFFKKVRNLMVTLSTMATSVLAVGSIPNISMPELVTKVASYILIASAAIGVTAQLTKTDNPTT